MVLKKHTQPKVEMSLQYKSQLVEIQLFYALVVSVSEGCMCFLSRTDIESSFQILTILIPKSMYHEGI